MSFTSFSLMKFIILLGLTSLFWKPATSLRSFDIRFTRSSCSILATSYVAFLQCPLIELPRNRGNYISGRVSFLQIIDNVAIDFLLTVPKGRNRTMDLIKFRIDGCRMSNFKSNNPLSNAINKMLLQAGNFPKSCPVKANTTYTVDHFAISPDYFAGYTPEMNFTVRLNMFMKKMKLFSASVDASLTKKK